GERLLLLRDMYFSYGFNGGGAVGGPGFPLKRGPGAGSYTRPSFRDESGSLHRVTSVRSASELILVADTTADGVEDYAIRGYPRNLFGGGPSQAAGDIHRGGANILFCDGHAEWRIQSELLLKYPPVPEEAARQRMWNV